MELVILVIPLFLLFAVALLFGRWAETKGVVADAAAAAVTAAAQANPSNYQSAADAAAAGVLDAHHMACSSSTVYIVPPPNGPGSVLGARVSCITSVSTLFPGLPVALTIQSPLATAVVPFASGSSSGI